ncbi:hypothetical protein GDO86_010665 [Hymenochirus boettgeri]|uniref:Snake toxin/toxin-like domain-containing protein n=1 Tax=Hymenochirus boettgeri TaxID=247094 RepID=A0A8T2JGH5_9PIPI|nr:hypothetical protein GDO86_010665 [Hymenochirus boettgeri]
MSTNDQYCTQVKNCSKSEPFCGTTIIRSAFLTVISKYCSAACVSVNQSLVLVSNLDTCCTSDLCNTQKIGNVNSLDFNGAKGLSSNASLLGTVACVLIVFLLRRT